MNFLLLLNIVFSVFGNDYDDEEFDPLSEIYDEFFDETPCFMSEKLEMFGDNSQKGIYALSTVNKGELLIKVAEDCAVCPQAVLSVYPFINYIREVWKDDVTDDMDDTLILIMYILLTDVNSHIHTIPDYHDYLVNFPIFWKTDMLESFSDDMKQMVESHREAIQKLLQILSPKWPYGRLSEKNLGVAYLQVKSRTFRLYESGKDPRVSPGTICFLPGLELFNQNITSNARILRNNADGSIALVATRKIAQEEQIVYDRDPLRDEMSDDFRLVNYGYTLHPTTYMEYFKEYGMQVQISSKHFEATCNEYIEEKKQKVNCSEIVPKFWPDYHAGRSPTPLFYGRTQEHMNAHPDLARVISAVSEDVSVQYHILDRVLKSKYEKHKSYMKLESRFASQFKIWFREALLWEIHNWRNLMARANQFRNDLGTFVFPDFAEECSVPDE